MHKSDFRIALIFRVVKQLSILRRNEVFLDKLWME